MITPMLDTLVVFVCRDCVAVSRSWRNANAALRVEKKKKHFVEARTLRGHVTLARRLLSQRWQAALCNRHAERLSRSDNEALRPQQRGQLSPDSWKTSRNIRLDCFPVSNSVTAHDRELLTRARVCASDENSRHRPHEFSSHTSSAVWEFQNETRCRPTRLALRWCM